MKVTTYQESVAQGSSHDVTGKVVFKLNGVELEVRQSTDGTCLVVAIRGGKVALEPRAAAIWIVVKP